MPRVVQSVWDGGQWRSARVGASIRRSSSSSSSSPGGSVPVCSTTSRLRNNRSETEGVGRRPGTSVRVGGGQKQRPGARGSWSWAALCRCSLRLRFALPGVPVSNCLGRLQGAACYPPPSPLAPMGTGCVAARVATARTLELCAFGTVTFQQILHFFANAVKTRGHHRATREKSVRGRRSEAMCNHAAWSTGL